LGNEFDDLDLELDEELELETSGEFEEGFKLQEPVEFISLDDDFLGTDELIIETLLYDRAPLGLEQSTPSTLAIGTEADIDLGADELDLGEIDIPVGTTYEVMVSPAERVLQLYTPPENHSFLIDKSNQEIHDIIYNPRQYGDKANALIRDFLNSEKMAVIPALANFSSPTFRKQQNFHSLLTSEFHNHRSIPNDYTVDHIIERVLDAFEMELPTVPLTKEKSRQIENAVEEFVLYAHSVFDEAERMTQLVQYKMTDGIIECPEVVGNFVYTCKCGEEYPMPEGRPTLTFLLKGQNNSTPIVAFNNTKIYCKKCNVYLALPTPLVDVMLKNMSDYIKRLDGVSYEQPRIYRPKISDLMEMIPGDAKELFNLDSGEVINEDNKNTRTISSEFMVYKKLIDLWMDSEVSDNKLREVVKSYEKSPQLVPLVKELSSVDFSFIPDLYSYQFSKTLIHYLERFSCFAITKQGLANYKFYELENYDRKAFSTEYALKWIYDNAAYLASLNNIFTGDTRMTSLHILPEYLDAINYVVGLHLLARPELLNKESDLAKWVKKPTAVLKDLAKIYKKLEPTEKQRLVTSHRDLRTSSTVHKQESWGEAYYFFKEVVAPKRYTAGLDPTIKSLALKAMRSKESDFYGVEIPENIYIKPALMFEEFSEAFKEFGHYLFTGPIVDEITKNLAKGIELYNRMGKLNGVFKSHEKPVNDISTVLVIDSPEEDEKSVQELLFELIIQRSDLPGDLNEVREEFGYKVILENFRDEYQDRFTTNEAFMEKYGEVVSCYL